MELLQSRAGLQPFIQMSIHVGSPESIKLPRNLDLIQFQFAKTRERIASSWHSKSALPLKQGNRGMYRKRLNTVLCKREKGFEDIAAYEGSKFAVTRDRTMFGTSKDKRFLHLTVRMFVTSMLTFKCFKFGCPTTTSLTAAEVSKSKAMRLGKKSKKSCSRTKSLSLITYKVRDLTPPKQREPIIKSWRSVTVTFRVSKQGSSDSARNWR